MPRTFPVPDGVFVGEVDGHKEFHTRTSPLPKAQSGDFLDEGFVPQPAHSVGEERESESVNATRSEQEPTQETSGTEDVEMIPLDEDSGASGTVEGESGEEITDPLHPPHKPPKAVGDDSGSLF